MGGARTVVVTGASGNVGTALLEVLATHDEVASVRALARRPAARASHPKVQWSAADVATTDLRPLIDGADAVVHLAWRIQPSWDLPAMRTTNIVGSTQVFEAAAAAGAALVHASSIGAYGPGPKDRLVDESWPTTGHPNHPYSAQKAEVERLLDGLERRHPDLRVVRIRPTLVVQASAGREQRRYFLPRHIPGLLLRRGLVERAPVRLQVVHAHDVALAFAAAALGDARGAFNIATTDVLGGTAIPSLELAARPLVWAAWRLHLQPVDPGWVTALCRMPLLDPGRAVGQLGWRPTRSGRAALDEVLGAMAHPPPGATPALTGDPA